MLAVLGVLFANGLIAILKFIGAGITGSSGMMAEAFHSVADTTSRGLLLGEAANAKVLQRSRTRSKVIQIANALLNC